ncbi:MAG: glycosyltransferase family 4 protein [Anaerolineales bacterium]
MSGSTVAEPLHICMIGTGWLISEHSRYLAQNGHNITVIGREPPPPPVQYMPIRDIIPLPIVRLVTRFFLVWWAVRRCPAEVFQVHYAANVEAWAVLASGVRPLVVSTEGSDVFQLNKLLYAGRQATRRLIGQADLVTGRTQTSLDIFQSWGVHPDKLVLVRGGIDLADFPPQDSTALRQALGLAPEARVLFSARALRPLYNIDQIVEAMPLVLAEHPQTVLLITRFNADPAYEQRIQHQIDQLGIAAAVRLLPEVIPPQDMAKYYSLADVVISVPRSDNFPRTVQEAWACRRAVLVGDFPSLHELVTPGEDAYVVPNHADQIAAGLVTLLGDDALRERLARAGYARAQAISHYTPYIQRLEDRLLELVAATSAQRTRPDGRIVGWFLRYLFIYSSKILLKFFKP